MTERQRAAERPRRTALVLGAASAVPFIAAAIAAWLLTDSLLANTLVSAAYLYGAVVLSFLGGIHWGVALRNGNTLARDYWFGVIPALIAWGALLIPMRYGLLLLAAALAGQFIADLRLSLPYWFRTLRAALTIVAITSLMLIIAVVWHA